MAGSHEVRGSIPLGSTKFSRFGIRRTFFISQPLMYYVYDWVRYNKYRSFEEACESNTHPRLKTLLKKCFKIGGCALKRFPYNSPRT